MNDILIFRHPDCDRCARIARTHQRFDLFGRISNTTETPPTGPLQMGEIVIEDRASGELKRGIKAFRLIVRAIPFYAPIRLLLRLPQFRAFIEREMGGCDGEACEIHPRA